MSDLQKSDHQQPARESRIDINFLTAMYNNLQKNGAASLFRGSQSAAEKEELVMQTFRASINNYNKGFGFYSINGTNWNSASDLGQLQKEGYFILEDNKIMMTNKLLYKILSHLAEKMPVSDVAPISALPPQKKLLD